MGKMNFDDMLLQMVEPKYIIFTKNPTDIGTREPERGILIDNDNLTTYVTDVDGAVIYETKISLARFRAMHVNDQIYYIIRNLENQISGVDEWVRFKEAEYLERTAFNADINTDNECDDITVSHFSLGDILMMILKCYSD